MNEIIERVAIELIKDELRAFSPEMIEEFAITNWFQFSDELKEKYLRPARAVILAMREPTIEMEKKGQLKCGTKPHIQDPNLPSFFVWQAMIDEALK
jgi:hypothetical protein